MIKALKDGFYWAEFRNKLVVLERITRSSGAVGWYEIGEEMPISTDLFSLASGPIKPPRRS